MNETKKSPAAAGTERKMPDHRAESPAGYKPDNMIAQVLFSFRMAFEGLFHVMLTQRNMRFHFCMALWVMCFAMVFDLTGFQKAYLFIVITFVISMEVLNTCIEALTDMLSPGYNRLAKIAKDTAAAAVLAVAIGSIMSAGYLLIPPFFAKFSQAAWMTEHAVELTAVTVIVSSILVYWILRPLRILNNLLLIPATSASAFSICMLSYMKADWITLCANMFFSSLIFNSLARNRISMRLSIAGHIAGCIVFTAFVYYIRYY